MSECKGCEEKMADITILNQQLDDRELFIQRQNEVLQLKQKVILAKHDAIEGYKRENGLVRQTADLQREIIRQLRKDRWFIMIGSFVVGVGIYNLANAIILMFKGIIP